MKGQVKSQTVDRYLSRVRQQIVDLVPAGSRVLELGCGNGDLLFRLSEKVEASLGIDHAQALVDYAEKRRQEEGLNQLSFRQADLRKGIPDQVAQASPVDVCIASLLLHVLPTDAAANLLEEMLVTAPTCIICGFAKPENWWQGFLLWLDQRFSGHYAHFKAYKAGGYMQGLFRQLEGVQIEEIDTFDPVIKIWVLRK